MSVTPVVLLIEDHTDLGEVIRDVMAKEGYDVITVSDPLAAVATLREQRVDLVIADIPTPEPGQADPLSEIVRDFPEVPLITLADETKSEIPFFGPWRASGGRVTLRRPFKLAHLLTVVREVVA